MKRNYNIFIDTNNKKDNFINIHVSQIDTIINHSADGLLCDCLEYLPPSDIGMFIKKLLEKLRPGSIITFIIYDIKQKAKDIYDNIINANDVLASIKHFNTLLTIDNIYTEIDINNFTLIQTVKNNNTITIAIKREKI